MEFKSMSEASRFYEVSQMTISNWAKRGDIKTKKMPSGKTVYEISEEIKADVKLKGGLYRNRK